MKWEEKAYTIGEKRVIERFLLIPKYIIIKEDNDYKYIYKWLEKAKWEEVYLGDGYWRDVRWIEEDA